MTIRGDYDDGTLTIEQWRRLQAQPPTSTDSLPGNGAPADPKPRPGTPLLPAAPVSAAEPAANRQARRCELCSAPIDDGADPRRRYCSASCRAKAAKRRREAGEGAASTTHEVSAHEIDLGNLPDLAYELLMRPEVREIEIRVADMGLVVRR